MKVSISIEAMFGMDWPLWKVLVPELEAMGFASIFRSDHFPLGTPPITDALELITSLVYLAEHTERVNFGSLVAPVSVREPVMLARQAMSIDDLSGGRMVLGVGAGWMESEHAAFGYPLGSPKNRLDRLDEALFVITSLIRSQEPVSFQGQFYKLQEARLLPRPIRPTRILVGGNGPKRTLPLVARYADIWNCEFETAERFAELSSQLDGWITAAGRHPSDVKRTTVNLVICYQSPEELHNRLVQLRKIKIFAGESDEELMGMLQSMKCILGSPQEVIEKIEPYAQAGTEEFVIAWFGIRDLDGLELIASNVLPHFHRLG
jgi:alkanesulfonate monooxygenase SsuD/methylene tetrahydromethanopterin reductase-like flavin-dependent oxidoreductase (luciferase family)